MDEENESKEQERIRRIVHEAYWKQAKRSLKVIFYIMVGVFAFQGALVILRWFEVL